MSPELDTYAITKKVKEVLTDNNLGGPEFMLLSGCELTVLLDAVTVFYKLVVSLQANVFLVRPSWV